MADEVKIGVDYSDLKGLTTETLKAKAAFGLAQHQSNKLKDSLAGMSSSIAKVNAGMQRHNAFMAQSTKGSRQMQLGVQQAGYQIQDFIVQVQAGTNPLIAFSQQGSQLAGFFAGPWGAAIGMGIAALSSLAMVLINTSGDAKTLKDSFDDLKDSGDRIKDVFDILNDDKLSETYGSMTASVRELSSAFIELNANGELRSLVATLDKLKKESEAGWLSKYLAIFSQGSYVGNTQTQQEIISGANEEEFKKYGFSMGRDAYLGYLDGMTAAAKSGKREAVLAEFQKLIDDAGDSGKAINGITDAGAELLNQLLQVNLQLAESRALLDGSAKAAQKAADAEKEAAKETEKKKNALEQVAKYQATLNDKINEEIAKRLDAQGLELQALDLRKQTAYDHAYAEVMAKAATEDQKRELVDSAKAAGEAASQAVQLASEADKAKEAAKGFADNLRDAVSSMSALSGLGSTIDKALAVSQARVVALKSGADATAAGTIAGYGYDIGQKRNAAISAGIPANVVNKMSSDMFNALAELSKSLQGEASLREAKKTGSSTPAGRIDTQEEYLAKLTREYDMKKKSAFMTDEQIKRSEFIFKMDEKIATMKTNTSATELEALRKQSIAAYDLYVASEKQAQLVKYASGVMENAFMSMVDGSKSVADAFKGMLREILLEVYRQQVAKPVSDFITGLFMANGGAFSNGSQVTAYANGGVVGSPTMFKHSGGLGLMGEAGPEAIMPLKRGSNGKLGVQVDGSQGGVVVNQTFNFSANGDDSVKKIIAQAAPQIAQMTQKQIMDSRRRGGSMKATFG